MEAFDPDELGDEKLRRSIDFSMLKSVVFRGGKLVGILMVALKKESREVRDREDQSSSNCRAKECKNKGSLIRTREGRCEGRVVKV